MELEPRGFGLRSALGSVLSKILQGDEDFRDDCTHWDLVCASLTLRDQWRAIAKQLISRDHTDRDREWIASHLLVEAPQEPWERIGEVGAIAGTILRHRHGLSLSRYTMSALKAARMVLPSSVREELSFLVDQPDTLYDKDEHAEEAFRTAENAGESVRAVADQVFVVIDRVSNQIYQSGS